MAKNIFTADSDFISQQKGQAFYRNRSYAHRVIWPAIVRSVDDKAGYNRIMAEMVQLNDKGQVISGRDRFKSSGQIMALPLLPEFMHVRPKPGEQVLLFLENPSDPTSNRYYIGPLISQQTKLNMESFEDSNRAMYNRNSFDGNQIGTGASTKNDQDAGELFAKQDEIAFQGRENGDLVIGKDFVKIRTGIFESPSFRENKRIPCQIELKIVNQPLDAQERGVFNNVPGLFGVFESFSQQNITATNINLISPDGSFRKQDRINAEMSYNPKLADYGTMAMKLQPSVLGDDLVDVLYNIINFLVTHFHQPQNPPTLNAFGYELLKFKSKIPLSQKILSKKVRLN